MKPVGMVGVGNMGAGMLTRLRALGVPVMACDIDAQRRDQALALGAAVVEHPAELARGLPDDGVLLVVVVDDAQTESVLWGPQGAVAAMRPGQAVVLCPTLSPQFVQEQGQRLQQAGLRVVDAPMSGGPQRAAEGQMSLMVACDAAAWAQVSALLAQLSTQVFRIGERVGDAARTKLVNNLLAAIALAGTAEVLAMAERMGLDAQRTLSVIEASSGQNWIGSDRMHRALAGDFTPRAHTTLLAKDSRLAVQAAQAAGFTPHLGQLAQHAFAGAVQEGMASLDDAAMLLWMRQTR
jgi:3-hydroxyisobutyrate dehydrogenase-like beta-hydroxyacid dehydrogenase